MSEPRDPWTPPPPDPYGPQPSPPGGYGGGPPSGPSGPRASFGLRLGAWLIDAILLGVVNTVLRAIVGVYPGFLLSLAVNFGYYGFFEGGPAGQTVGKLALGIRTVRKDDFGPLGWSTALYRNLCRILSGLACLLGYLWMLWDPEKMTWHDKLSNTIVVPCSEVPPPPNSFGQPPAPV
jgi:uncharacterized RDD family membrane protein YckC